MTAYPSNVRWLRYRNQRDFKRLVRAVWWISYTAGVGAASVGIYRLATILNG